MTGSPYFDFKADVGPAYLLPTHPDYVENASQQDIAKLLGKRWRVLGDAGQAVYRDGNRPRGTRDPSLLYASTPSVRPIGGSTVADQAGPANEAAANQADAANEEAAADEAAADDEASAADESSTAVPPLNADAELDTMQVDANRAPGMSYDAQFGGYDGSLSLF